MASDGGSDSWGEYIGDRYKLGGNISLDLCDFFGELLILLEVQELRAVSENDLANPVNAMGLVLDVGVDVFLRFVCGETFLHKIVCVEIVCLLAPGNIDVPHIT